MNSVGKLIQLLEHKESRALEACRKHRVELQNLQIVVDEHDNKVKELLVELNRVNGVLQQVSKSNSVSFYQSSQVRRNWLLFDLEKESYFLNQSKEELGAAQQSADELTKTWLRIRKRYQKHTDRVSMTVSLNLALAEMVDELEMEDMYNPLESSYE